MRFYIRKPYEKLWWFFGLNPENGISLRDCYKKADSDERRSYRSDGLAINKPYSKFKEELSYSRRFKHIGRGKSLHSDIDEQLLIVDEQFLMTSERNKIIDWSRIHKEFQGKLNE